MTGFTDRSDLQPETKEERLKPIVLVLDVIDDRRIKSVCVADPADRRITAWLPRAQITMERPVLGRVRITLPTWLAIDRGLMAVASRDQKTLF